MSSTRATERGRAPPRQPTRPTLADPLIAARCHSFRARVELARSSSDATGALARFWTPQTLEHQGTRNSRLLLTCRSRDGKCQIGSRLPCSFMHHRGMQELSRVDVEVDGRYLEFHVWPNESDYETNASNVEVENIYTCIGALEKYSARPEAVIANSSPQKIDLWVDLDPDRLYPWEKKTVLGIGITYDDADEYVAEFSLHTALGMSQRAAREAILSIVESSGFVLKRIKAEGGEMPSLEEYGQHRWTCWVSEFPKAAKFGDLFALRNALSQAVFLLQDVISTPYLALRMVQLGQAQELLGLQESEWLECKSSPYEFKKAHEALWKHELAEDVTQFANNEAGGLLLVGFRTNRKSGVDTIERIAPVPASDTRLQMYRDVLKRRIHPPISRLIVESFPWKNGYIICIFIPPQRYENQPYLVSGMVVAGRYIRSGFTIVRRQGDSSIPVTAEEVHSTLVAGRAFLRGSLYASAEDNDTESDS